MNDVLNCCIAINQDHSFEILRDDCLELTKYKIEVTYPGPIPEEIEVAEVKQAIKRAHRIKDFILNNAKELGYY